MSDYIDATFAELDEYYPGSKRKRKSVEKPAPVVKEVKSWDSKPYIKTMPNGTDMEMYTIGALADALGRPLITVRDWVNKGYLPQAPYRLPSHPNKNGDTHQGRRLYSRSMIESAVEVFSESGLLDVVRIDWKKNKNVTFRIAETWNTIRNTELNTADNA
jgi:hypothetical protein